MAAVKLPEHCRKAQTFTIKQEKGIMSQGLLHLFLSKRMIEEYLSRQVNARI